MSDRDSKDELLADRLDLGDEESSTNFAIDDDQMYTMDERVSPTHAQPTIPISQLPISGTKFKNEADIKSLLTNYSLATGFDTKTRGSQKSKSTDSYGQNSKAIRLSCRVPGCPWKFNYSYRATEECWYIGSQHLHHACVPTRAPSQSNEVHHITHLTNDHWERIEWHLTYGHGKTMIRNALTQPPFGTISFIADNVLTNAIATLVRLRPKYTTDGATLSEWMNEEAKLGATVAMSQDSTWMLRAAFWMPHESKRLFAGCPQVLSIDCTYCVSRSSGAFMIFTGIDEELKSFPVACCHFQSENIESYKWCFKQLAGALGEAICHKIACVMTDGDIKFNDTIRIFAPEAKHLRCIWHILKNVRTNLVNKLGEEWQPFLKMYRKMMYCESIDQCEELYNQIKELYPSSEEYLDKNIWPDRKQFMTAWTKEYFTLLCRTNGRSETMNRNLKQCEQVNKKTTLLKVFQSMKILHAKTVYTRKERYRRAQLTIRDRVSLFPIIEGFDSSLISGYAATSMQKQISQCHNYDVKYVANESKGDGTTYSYWAVSHRKYPNKPRLVMEHNYNHLAPTKCMYPKTSEQTREAAALSSFGTLQCSCSYPNNMGLPCRHWMAVARFLHVDHISLHHISKRWILETLNNSGNMLDKSQPRQPKILISIADDGLRVPGFRNLPHGRSAKYNYLTESFKELATLGSESLAGWEFILKVIPSVRARMLTGAYEAQTTVMMPSKDALVGRQRKDDIKPSDLAVHNYSSRTPKNKDKVVCGAAAAAPIAIEYQQMLALPAPATDTSSQMQPSPALPVALPVESKEEASRMRLNPVITPKQLWCSKCQLLTDHIASNKTTCPVWIKARLADNESLSSLSSSILPVTRPPPFTARRRGRPPNATTATAAASIRITSHVHTLNPRKRARVASVRAVEAAIMRDIVDHDDAVLLSIQSDNDDNDDNDDHNAPAAADLF